MSRVASTQNAYTLPPRPPNTTLAEFPDGWTECLLSKEAMHTVISTPDYPQPIPNHAKPVYRINNTSTMGLGMFATHDLHMADLILSERPLIIVPAARIDSVNSNTLPGVTLSSKQTAQASREYENELKILFGRLDPENQHAFMSLANSHTEDGSSPLLGRIRTNRYAVSGLQEPGPCGGYYGVCKLLSRINHSCTPNVCQIFDMTSFSFILRAARPIKTGEEMFIAYTNVLAPYTARQKALESYGFHCTCSSCSNPTESDLIRTQIKQSVAEASELMKSWLTTRSLSDCCVLHFCSHWLTVIQEHKLESTAPYCSLVKLCYDAAVALGDEDLFAKMSIEYAISSSVQAPAAESHLEKLGELMDVRTSRSTRAWGLRKASGKEDVPDFGWVG